MIQRSLLILFGLVGMIAGCVSWASWYDSSSFNRPTDCEVFFKRLDEQVKKAKVSDASSFPVSGFPYLRTNRFLSALKERLNSEQERQEWVSWMFALNLQARETEIRNLPSQALASLSIDREALLGQTRTCSQDLFQHDQKNPHFYSLLKPRVVVPDEYSFPQRIVGVYPLFALPVAAVTENARRKMRERFEVDLEALPRDGILTYYLPEKIPSLGPREIERIVEASRRNAFKAPRPNETEGKQLAQFFAPALIQDVAASYDSFGELGWKQGRPAVHPMRPVVYYYFTNGFMKGDPTLQINYVIWYSERAGKTPPFIEKGHLDGLTIRFSLDLQGSLFMVDIQNNCGCYHFYVPAKGRIEQVHSKLFQFDALIVQYLPEVSDDQRLGILISSGWHQPQRLIAIKETHPSLPYDLLPYDLLESLPHEDGRRESLFDEKGIAKESQRVERFLLFSMGIPSIGSMRQRGHHATELIGRTHFDDPYLFDKHFIFK